MTAKEAIEVIEMAIAVVEWEYPLDYAAAFDEAVKALEKQVPKMPARSERVSYCEVWKCPHCGFEFSSRIVDYCYRCGQAIDWSEV